MCGLLLDPCCPVPRDLEEEEGLDGVAKEDEVSGFK